MIVLRPYTYPDRSASKFRFWGRSQCFLIFNLDPVSLKTVPPTPVLSGLGQPGGRRLTLRGVWGAKPPHESGRPKADSNGGVWGIKDLEALGPFPEAEFRCGSIWIGLRPQNNYRRSFSKENIE